MQIRPWHPLRDLDDAFNRYAHFFKGGFANRNDDDGNASGVWMPSADISESRREYLIKAELPDVESSDIHVTVKNGALTIEGERKHRDEEEGETWHRVESYYGRFARAFALPSDADESKIQAECKRGVLRVHIPKTKESKTDVSREIMIT